MRTKNNMRHLLMAASVGVALQGFTQASILGHGGGPSYFLGWNASAQQALEVRHDGSWPIDFWTSQSFRARINPQITYGLLGSFTNVPADGFALITPNASFLGAAKGPFTRLHLADGGAGNTQDLAFRRWMSNGFTFTGNLDHGYIGQKYGDEDYTDMVIQWSDNPGNYRMDRMRFLFTSGYDENANTGALSKEGLEGMRLWPVDYHNVHVGVGDFYADGTDPTDRLHVLNGRVRIEELPNDPEAQGLTKVVVVDDANTNEHGVLKWMDMADVAAVDCEWRMNTGANNDLYTAQGTADPNCPDAADRVLIGAAPTDSNIPSAKLHVRAPSGFERGVDVLMSNAGSAFGAILTVTGGGQSVRGVQAITNGSSNVARAGDFISYDASPYAHGVNAQVHSGTGYAAGVEGSCYTSAGSNYGVKGEVRNTASTGAYYGVHGSVMDGPVAPFRVGVYGRSPVIPADANTTGELGSWAGYFNGMVRISNNAYVNGNVLVTSDASLKTNIEDITNASALIGSLQPKTFDFIPQQHPHLLMPEGRQWGLLAQEVQEVIPDLVERVPVPAVFDSTGAMTAEATAHLAVNYNGLIPVLIAAMKEQNARIDHLEQALAACCANPDGGRILDQGLGQPSELDGSLNGNEKLRIQPNPFNERTTVYYTLERGGRTQLIANSADGKELRVLHEANLEPGVTNTSGIQRI